MSTYGELDRYSTAKFLASLADRGIVRYGDSSFLDYGGSLGPLVMNSFTGADITCSIVVPRPPDYENFLRRKGIDPNSYKIQPIKVIAEIETLSVSSARSVYPVRRLGEHHVHKHTRGGRSIAGSLVFTTFSRDVFADIYRIHPQDHSGGGSGTEPPFFTDQLPPFHILIQAANEYGMVANAALINVTIANFGTTFSIHDLKTESTYTYVAQHFYPFVQDHKAFQNVIRGAAFSRDRPLSEVALVGLRRDYGVDGQEPDVGRKDDPIDPTTQEGMNELARSFGLPHARDRDDGGAPWMR